MAKYPECERRELLRTMKRGPVVSSAALYHSLGNAAYQRFIREGQVSYQPEKGFEPADVEAWLTKHGNGKH